VALRFVMAPGTVRSTVANCFIPGVPAVLQKPVVVAASAARIFQQKKAIYTAKVDQSSTLVRIGKFGLRTVPFSC
jgi:hypothetical protein